MEEGAINPTIGLPELTQPWEIDSGRAQQNPVHQDPGERSSDPRRDCPGLACGCPGVSGGGVGGWWPAAGLGALSAAVHAWHLLREVTIIFIASTKVLQRGAEAEDMGEDLSQEDPMRSCCYITI